MPVDAEPAIFRDAVLTPFDLGVVELLDPPALEAHQMVMVAALVQFEHRLAAFEVMPLEQTGMLELREDAVHGGEPDVVSLRDEESIHVLGGKMPDLAALEQIENLEPRSGGLEADGLEILRRAHGG